MPTIYDNIDRKLLDGLRAMLDGAKCADFCVGYFNLRGWGQIADHIDRLSAKGVCCRLLIGIYQSPDYVVQQGYGAHELSKMTQRQAHEHSKRALKGFAKQLTLGCPSADDERHLQKLAEQLDAGKLQVRFHGSFPLHAKLYLVHRLDTVAPLAGVVGSSNLTLAGLERNGELNVDVLDQDSAQKLQDWFEDRWEDAWSVEITSDLVEIIRNSWAGGAIAPYDVYLKTAFELSREAISGINQYPLPEVFQGEILSFQEQAVSIAARILEKRDGVIIGDVVGLGKTMIASAVAKTFQEDQGDNVLVICPPNLQSMWKDYAHKFRIAADTLSSGKIRDLSDMRRYKLIIVDESHNFRNRDTRRYSFLRDYINDNESRVILLTATPYNKAFSDIANQLRLFLPPDLDLGIRPERQIAELGGAAAFKAQYSQILISSLAAFETSEHVEDWRELMRLFMVRRTRSYIQNNFAEYDSQKNRHFLTFGNQERFYFPLRVPKRLDFSFDISDKDGDQYAKLYSPLVVDAIGDLSLPRYGIGNYIDKTVKVSHEDHERILKNLARAGKRLIGFARTGLFKRLESSGETFLISIRRHIIRNSIFLAALESTDTELPIGQVFSEETDDAIDEHDADLFDDDMPNLENWQKIGQKILKELRTSQTKRLKYDWILGRYFLPGLRKVLLADNEKLLKILAITPDWRPSQDRKLQALATLLTKTHSQDKVLVFTQFKDTAKYLLNALSDAGVESLSVADSDSEIQSLVRRFSPQSNSHSLDSDTELRVLIATDALSEGQNLQDAHIIVNYDLPWAIIRLIQRVGRVDRIGQKAQQILCYSALPEDGIEDIINLRRRLTARIQDNAELVGTDERFFEDDQQSKELRSLYAGEANLDDKDDETDLLSRAYDIWHQAEQNDPDRAERIRKLPDVIYSAKASNNTDHTGVIAYIRQGGNDILAHLNSEGDIISQSQSSILDFLQCEADTPKRCIADNHHQCVRMAIQHLERAGHDLGGQLGGSRSIRHKLYKDLKFLAMRNQNIESQELRQVIQAIYDRPLTENARQRFRRLYTTKVDRSILQQAALSMHEGDSLCVRTDQRNRGTSIICSMGLLHASES